MPFNNADWHPYTISHLHLLDPGQNGVYGIFSDNEPVYVGSGDIRERMIAHLNGDNDCITSNTPNQWLGELVPGDPKAREGELIQELRPRCNQPFLRQ